MIASQNRQAVRVTIYARVSTVADSDCQGALQDQIEACRKAAEPVGYEVVAEYRDVASGATPDRPGLSVLRARAQAREIDYVFCYGLDRVSRSAADLVALVGEFQERGVTLHDIEDAGAAAARWTASIPA